MCQVCASNKLREGHRLDVTSPPPPAHLDFAPLPGPGVSSPPEVVVCKNGSGDRLGRPQKVVDGVGGGLHGT